MQWFFRKKNFGFYENVCVESNLSCNYKLQKKTGEQDVLLAPQINLLGEQLLPLPPVPAPMGHVKFLEFSTIDR